MLVFEDAALLDFDLVEIRGRGQTQFDWHPVGQITLSNIGSSGDDGADFGGGFTLRAIHNESLAGPPAPGASMRFASRFVDEGAEHPDELLVDFELGRDLFAMSADFSAVGATTMTVEVLLDGQVFQSIDGLAFNIEVLETDKLPGCDVWDVMGNGVVDVRLAWSPPTVIVIDGNVYTADAIRLTPDDGDPIDGLLSSSRTAANIDDIEILDIIVTPLSCPGDVDADGVVGVLDLLALFASWGPCPGCPADLDGSGNVNVADMLVLFSSWGPCP